jgi:hypothetical protein
MINMGYQPETGTLLGREFYAGEVLPFYIFVTRGTSENEVVIAGVGDEIMGVTVPSEEKYWINSEGETVLHDSYLEGEMPLVQVTGIGHVKCGEALDEEAKVVANSDGEAVEETLVSGIAQEMKKRGGTMLDSGANNAIVRINLDRRV